jgi:hypothetical protein
MNKPCCSICNEVFNQYDATSFYSVGDYVDIAHENCLKNFLLQHRDDITIKATYFVKTKDSEKQDD